MSESQTPSLSSSVSSLDTASTASGIPKSRLPKFAGSKSGSKIERICGNQHKPAVPSSLNSSDDSVRRMTDEFGRHRLTDVMEEENEDEIFFNAFTKSPNRKRYSSIDSAVSSSMDTLWDLHPRRLSEAGLSRHSDSSAVLTEDTDSFIIGERVWVSGTKPGHIAFIGETQFAPGDWAGIALDEPIGKNDGSVGGIRYFQCEPKKGVFARLTRLTRFPLNNHGMGSGDTYTTSPSPVNNGTRRSPISPTGSTRGILKSPTSIGGSNTSLHIDYKLGDRVIIKSSQGSKVGTVRFIGTTEFAPGEWVGVELDDPRGKNDGSVNGIRYFDCRPNFGLFAPMAKVSKSPSKVKPNACQIHSGSGLPPSGIKKFNSKESLLSGLSSASSNVRRVRLGVTSLSPKRMTPKSTSTPLPARTALQDVLKEKEQQIEQIIKERDLERAEFTRAATQVEDAEHKYVILKKDYEKYKSECEIAFNNREKVLNDLQQERDNILEQLEEERRKNEDLQFKLAETAIGKEDAEITSDSYIQKINDLNTQLNEERQKIENLELECSKLSEIEAALIKSKEEIDLLQTQLQESRNKELALEGNTASTTVLISTLEKEIEQRKADLQERDELILVLKNEINKITLEAKKSVEDFNLHKTELESMCNVKNEEISRINTELEQIKKLLQDKVAEIEKISTEKLNTETFLEKEVEKLKMDISSKVLDLENLSEENKGKDVRISELENEIKVINERFNAEKNQANNLENILSEKCKDQEKVIEEVKSENKKLLDEIQKLDEDLKLVKVNYEESVKKVEDLTASLNEKDNKIKEIFDENQLIKNMKEQLEKVCENNEIQLKELNLELNKKSEELTNNLKNFTELQTEFNKKINENDELKHLLEKTVNEKDASINSLNETIKTLESQIQSLQTELNTTKIDLESNLKNLQQYQTNLSDVEETLKKERDELKEALKSKMIELDDVRKKLTDNLTDKDKQLEELNAAISKKNEEILSRDEIIENLRQTHAKDLADLTERLSNEIDVRDKKIEEMKGVEEKVHVLTEEKNQLEQKLVNVSSDDQQKSLQMEKAEEVKKELQSKVELLEKEKVEIKKEANIKIEEILQEKDAKINILEAELKTTNDSMCKVLEDLKTYENNLLNVESTLKNEKEEIITNFDAKIKELESARKEFEETVNRHKNDMSIANENLVLKDEEIKKLNEEIEMLKTLQNQSMVNIEEKHKKEFEDMEIKISDLLTEIENKNMDISNLSNSVSMLEQEVLNKNKELGRLNQDFTLFKDQQSSSVNENVMKLQEEIKKLVEEKQEILKNLKSFEENANVVLQENEKLKLNHENSLLECKNTQEKLKEVEKRLQETESEKIKALEGTKEHLLENEQELEKLKSEINVERNEFNQNKMKLLELQKSLENTRETLVLKEKALNEKNSEISKLKDEMKKLQSQPTAPKPLDNDAKSNENPDYKQLLEEKIFAENQVAFLNSIIVDMQKKNEEQKAKIEILEMGYNAAAADELVSLGLNPNYKQPPPRVYCDICEEFDLHETEDCPTQGEDEPINNNTQKEKKQKPPPRPYCELCEAFGHSTEDCNVEMEF